MSSDILGDRISTFCLTDPRGIDSETLDGQNRIEIVDSWKEIYAKCDILITCTVSDKPLGMAVFDIGIANYYFLQAKMKGIGEDLS